MLRSFRLFITAVIVCLTLCLITVGQETDRSPLAIEFPELATGRQAAARITIADSGINVVKFWILNPVADMIPWGKVRVRINGEPSNTHCKQMAAAEGKNLLCTLNQKRVIKIAAIENLFEIEAVSEDGKRYFATFTTLTERPQAAGKIVAPGSPKNTLGFSGRKFAVVMGVSQYEYNDNGLRNLNYADDDADALAAWLRSDGGFLPDDILHLTNKDATLASVRDSLRRFLNKAGPTDLVLFFFAGHGTPDPYDPSTLYYLLHDSKVADLKQTGFPMTELKRIIDENLISKRVVFFLDTCHSAGVGGGHVAGARKGTIAAGDRNLSAGMFDERQLERVSVRNSISQGSRLFASEGRAVVTSSSVDETSRESLSWGNGHGIFTWSLLEGLRGKSDANGDRVITVQELFKFVYDRVRAETGQKQNPQLFSSLAGEIQIAVVKRGQ